MAPSIDSKPRQEAATERSGVASLGSTGAKPRMPGDRIDGKYRLDRLLGEGGMGTVWEAQNLLLEVPVAIKLLHAGQSSTELIERLRIEARAAAKLVHASIVRVFDIGEASPGEPYIVMELLRGESLSTRIQREHLPPLEAVQLLLPIAEALSLAHSSGVVHRDLKPDNIVLCPEGDFVRPKLLDFGIAKVTGGANMVNITQRGMLVGSPAYMSPEQARGSDDLDFRTDIWSFCVVLYEALSGDVPFDGEGGGGLLRAIVADAPKPLNHLDGVDAALWGLIARGLSKAPEQRPATMFELGRALARWLRENGVREDATGAALDWKWLPRVASTIEPTPWVSLAPAVQEAGGPEHSTFESMVRSERRAGKAPGTRGAWRAVAVVLGVVAALLFVGGAVAWSRGIVGSSGENSAAAAQAAESPVVAAHPAAMPVMPPSSSATAAAEPVVSPAAAKTLAQLPMDSPRPAPAPAPTPKRVKAAPTTRRANPSAGSPRVAPAVTDSASDLMQPY
jgi:serine/threonine-protein kinase